METKESEGVNENITSINIDWTDLEKQLKNTFGGDIVYDMSTKNVIKTNNLFLKQDLTIKDIVEFLKNYRSC